MKLEHHPAAALFPMMTDSEIVTLAEDIRTHGQQSPIVTIGVDGQTLILDGRNRAAACWLLGLEPRRMGFGGDDPVAFVVNANLPRRRLNDAQRALVAADVARLMGSASPSPVLDAATLCKVSLDSVRRARAVREQGIPELQARVANGTMAVKTAARLASAYGPEEQRRRLASGELPAAPPSRKPKASEPPSPRILDHHGRVAKEDARGVLRVAAPVREISDYNGRTHVEKHEVVRELTKKGYGPKAIVAETGLTDHFVHHSRRAYALPKKDPLAGAISDAHSFADTWSSAAVRPDPKWAAASPAARETLVDALEECARAAKRMIQRLKKDTVKEPTGT